MFRFNYPMPAETKLRNAKRHNLDRAASHLNCTILKLLAHCCYQLQHKHKSNILPTRMDSKDRSTHMLQHWQQHYSQNLKLLSKITITLPPFCPCPAAQRESSGSLQWPNGPQQWNGWEDRGSLLLSPLLVFVTVTTQKTYCGGDTKV